MFSQLIRHTSTVLHISRPLVPWQPSSLSALHLSPHFRLYSWSGQSQPANWAHLSDTYNRGAEVRPRETPMSPDASWAEQSRARMSNLTPPRGPYAGRSIEVKNGNVADALNNLQYTLQRNRVVSELRLAARHEKKGYKRRRLNSQRWRRRFAHEVRKKVQLVNQIRARGA